MTFEKNRQGARTETTLIRPQERLFLEVSVHFRAGSHHLFLVTALPKVVCPPR